METVKLDEEVPMLLPSIPIQNHEHLDDIISGQSHSTAASVCNSTYGSDGIFDRNPLRSPINGSESEYEDEDDLISEMPPESHAPSCYGEELGNERQEHETHNFLEYTPGRRSPFRNPSSVRGMQLDTTPPQMRSPSRDSMSKARERLSMGSRNSTPRSVRSYRSGSPIKHKFAAKKETLLVLLHVTILPISCPYSAELLQEIAPPHVLQNWKLLREKVPETVLERGILIPHPREEYELLEERLLESLELAVPRILKCGHFHRSTTDDEESDVDCESICQNSHDSANDSGNDPDVCVDCTRHIRDGSRGSNGTGKRRWNIRFYAANGLMRAGAWSAAWKEMERVDVEISPWIDDELRRTLDLRRLQEQETQAKELEEQHHELHGYPLNLSSSPSNMDEARRREIYGDAIPSTFRRERIFTPGEIVEAYEYSPARDDPFDHTDTSFPHLSTASPQAAHSTSSDHHTIPPSMSQKRDIPMTELLRNYIKLLLQGQRNVALAFLSVIVVWLALRPDSLTPPTESAQQLASTATGTVKDALSSVTFESPLSSLSSASEGLSSSLVSTLADVLLPTSVVDSLTDDQQHDTDPPLDI